MHTRLNQRGTTLASLLALAVYGCGSGGDGPTTPAICSVTGVAVTPSSIDVTVGSTATLTATVRQTNCPSAPTVAWESSNSAIATVSASGQVTGISLGSATIAASAGGHTATASVTIRPIPVASVTISAPVSELNAEGGTLQLSVVLRDAANNTLAARSVTWSSDSAVIATVSSSGLVIGRGAGRTRIRARSDDGKEGTLEISVRGLIHRWSFEQRGGTGTTLTDGIRGAHATIVAGGNARATAGGGQVTLAGGPRGTADFIALPPGLFKNLTDATIEVWATPHSVRSWSRIFDIGSGSTNHLFMTWTQGITPTSDRVAFTVNGVEQRLDNSMGSYTLQAESHIVMVVDEDGGAGGKTRITLYRDGAAKGSFDTDYQLRLLADDNVWLGRSQYVPDETANASYNEFSIYDRTFSASDIQQMFAKGPGGSGAAKVGSIDLTPTSATVQASPIGQPGPTLALTAVAVSNTGNALPYKPLMWTSSNPAIATVSSTGVVTGLTSGHAAITVVSEGKTATAQISVTAPAVFNSLSVTRTSGTDTLFKAVGARTTLRALGTSADGKQYVVQGVTWSSTKPSVATVDGNGVLTTTGLGQAEIVAAVGTLTARWSFSVAKQLRVPVDPYLATPMAGALWEIPVVIIAFMPTADGENIDVRKNPGFWALEPMTLDSVERRILDYARRKKMMLEEGSRYRGYSNTIALPSLGYRIVDQINVYDLVPPSAKRGRELGGPFHPDFHKIIADLSLEPLMRSRTVREIWIVDSGFDAGFPSFDAAMHDPKDFRTNWESNMSSPLTGDISNSDRDPNDLPVLSHTYVVYGINYRRSQAEAAHNVGHQLEAILSYVNQRQDGNSNLFWKQFVGQDATGAFITGRAGWTHMPPNTMTNYDYLNMTLVPSDIEDWRSDATGSTKAVNANTWGSLIYPWPGVQQFSQRVESQWYTYWWQNFPGRSNQIKHGSRWMSNWWAYMGNWDSAIQSGLGLHGPTVAAQLGDATLGPATRATKEWVPWVETPPRHARPRQKM